MRIEPPYGQGGGLLWNFRTLFEIRADHVPRTTFWFFGLYSPVMHLLCLAKCNGARRGTQKTGLRAVGSTIVCTSTASIRIG
ncbi:MAG: hypothetical protein D6691_07660 [Candidatus Hydrogenedentota bacterium]|nr:MAG: hypothetical protein D6691_07660 [Candidatus Hydrogenedentota bacterium]